MSAAGRELDSGNHARDKHIRSLKLQLAIHITGGTMRSIAIDMPPRQLAQLGVLTGLAGGAAEVAWIASYCSATGGDPSVVAGSIATAVLSSSSSPMLGLSIHLALSVALGLALATAWQSSPGEVLRSLGIGEYHYVVMALALVWAVNFFVVLPIVSPDFTTLLPLWATLASKLLFGIVAASTLRYGASHLAPVAARRQ